MDMSGEYLVPAPRQKVWEALNDPEILKQCIPGCEEVNRTGDNAFDAKVSAKVGPVKAKFTGAVTLSDIDPPNGYTISGEGKGGAAGFAKGGAKVALSDAEGGTLLKYDVNAQVGGKLAQIGARLIDSTAKKMANDFFKTFSEVVGEGGEAPAAATAPAPATADEGKDKAMSKDGVPAENVYHGLHWTAVLTTGVAIASLVWFAMTALSF
ncbi:SRPBCC family protein [Nisaea sediminum]|uniref:SRPBCC family protein n=1 Tax=Nisaea sediminum TaxID=2775867 RepID=UPI00186764EB|nr:carbon monoxide dehydrogenase subunit G [Nisaea sediminum]